MTKNQFFYTRRVKIQSDEPTEALDSFNVENVIRSILMDDGQRLVLLNDIHERIIETPITNKRNEITGSKREKQTVQTEVFLSPEDSDRFVKLLNIE